MEIMDRNSSVSDKSMSRYKRTAVGEIAGFEHVDRPFEETNPPAGNGIDGNTARATAIFMARIREQYPVSDALLFGSRARGDFRPDSDADVAVLLRGEPERLLPTKLAMADIAFDVLLETGILVQPLPIWEAQWKNPDGCSNPYPIRNIARERMRL